MRRHLGAASRATAMAFYAAFDSGTLDRFAGIADGFEARVSSGPQTSGARCRYHTRMTDTWAHIPQTWQCAASWSCLLWLQWGRGGGDKAKVQHAMSSPRWREVPASRPEPSARGLSTQNGPLPLTCRPHRDLKTGNA